MKMDRKDQRRQRWNKKKQSKQKKYKRNGRPKPPPTIEAWDEEEVRPENFFLDTDADF